MNKKSYAEAAAHWALNMVGCEYSQARRLKKGVFDCSSLVARAYQALGKRWRYGGSTPISMYEVYDDDFELLWPSSYAQIGKSLGGREEIAMASQAGDLQFLCTDPETQRMNRITHVAMVADEKRIVHARGTKYGVCTNEISLYAGKVCAVTRYNPVGVLRMGMCGWRTLALQQALNKLGADLSEDGEFGQKTQKAVYGYQKKMGMPETGAAEYAMLVQLGLVEQAGEEVSIHEERIRITGRTVNLRKGPGTEYGIVGDADRGESFAVVKTEGWAPIKTSSGVCWVSEQYAEYA